MIIQLYNEHYNEPAYWLNLSPYAQTEVLHFFGQGKKLQAPAFVQRFGPAPLAERIADLLGAPNPDDNLQSLQKLINFPIRKIYGSGLMQISNGALIAVKVKDAKTVS